MYHVTDRFQMHSVSGEERGGGGVVKASYILGRFVGSWQCLCTFTV